MSKHSKRSAKRKTFFLVILFLLILCISAFSAYTFELKPRKAYMAAEAELAGADYAAAAELYSTLGSYKDSRAKADYTSCAALFNKDNITEAAEYYKKLSGQAKEDIDKLMGSFETLGKQALVNKEFDNAWAYLSIADLSDDTKAALSALEIRKEALELINSESYSEARELLHGTDDTFIDASSLVEKCFQLEFAKYEEMSRTDMNMAVGYIETIADYLPAARFIKELQENYSQAINWVKEGAYADARTLFEKFGNYKDSEKLLAKCEKLLSGETVNLYEKGDLITLGTLNGETIIWLVVDVNDGNATLVSQNPVAHIAFDENGIAEKWTDSTLCKWLKKDFMNCFNASEKNQISNITVRFGNDMDTCYVHAVTEEETALLAGFDFSTYGKVWISCTGETPSTARAFQIKNPAAITDEPSANENDVMAVIRLKF